MKMNFEYFQIQKWILQTASTEKVDEKNGVIYPVFMFPSWDVVHKLSKKLIFFFQFYADISKKSKQKKFTYIHLKGLVMHFQKMVLFIMLWLTVSEIFGFEVKEFC